MTSKNRFDQPYFIKADDDTPDINDILAIGKEGDLFKLKKESLIKKIPVNVSDTNNNNLFHLILKDDLKKTEINIINFFKYLLENNTNPEQPNFKNRTPLHYACMNHYNKIIKYLLEIGCNPNFKDDFGMTPMHYYMGGNVQIYEDKSPKPIRNYENNLDILKNEEVVTLYKTIYKYIKDKYKKYFTLFDNMILNIIPTSDSYAEQLLKILSKNVMTTEDNKKNQLEQMKSVRNVFETAFSNIFKPKDILENINNQMVFKSCVSTKSISIYPKCNNNIDYYIFDYFKLDDYIKNFKSESYIKINEIIRKNEPDSESDSESDSDSDQDVEDNNEDAKEGLKTFLSEIDFDNINKENDVTKKQLDTFLYVLNDIIRKKELDQESEKLIIDILNIFIDILNIQSMDKILKDNLEYDDKLVNFKLIKNIFNKYTLEEIDENSSKKKFDLLIEYFIKKIIDELDNELDNSIIKDTEQFYNENIIIKNEFSNIRDLNIKVLYITIITDVVTNYLAHRINNKINHFTMEMLSVNKSTNIDDDILNIVDDDNIKFIFKSNVDWTDQSVINEKVDNVDWTDQSVINEKVDNVDKKFIMFSDDYSTLELEKELLELKINKTTFNVLLQHGATIGEKDGNGRYPLDNIIDNKYYCIVDEYIKDNEYNKYNFNKDLTKRRNTLNYTINTLTNHLESFNNEELFIDNQYKDLEELIESTSDEYNYQMFKNNKKSFIELNNEIRTILSINLMINNDTDYKNIRTSDQKKRAIKKPLEDLNELYIESIKYFKDEPFYNDNTSRNRIYTLLVTYGNEYIKEQIKIFICIIIKQFYEKNAINVLPTPTLQLWNSGCMLNKSLNNDMDIMIEEFIKNACNLFETEDEMESHQYSTASDILDKFIDKIAFNEYIPITLDSKLLKILKKMVVGYFDNFVYRMLENWMIVYENNLKFIINHYRLLKIADIITES